MTRRQLALSFSPLAIATALAACSGGAEGQTDPTGGLDGASAAERRVGDTAALTPMIDARISVSRSSAIESRENAAAIESGPAELAEPRAALESAEAMAQFAQSQTGSQQTLAAAGLEQPLPSAGQCLGPQGSAPSGSFAALDEVQLLDVGEVTLRPLPLAAQAEGVLEPLGEGVSLAPHAFPSISGFVSGVVYTSRDRAPAALPSGVKYRVSVAGSPALAGFEVLVEAPGQLSQVTLGGEPFENLTQVTTAVPLDATWSVGQPGDLVMIELSNADGAARVRCAFADEVGAGSVPVEWLGEIAGAGRVAMHRRRTQEGPLPSAVAAGTGVEGLLRVTFDLETNRAVQFAPEPEAK